MIDLTKLARDIHANNVAAGWWDGIENKMDRYETCMMLVVSELSEALEGHRKDLMDDHLPHRPMFHVELADAMIRLLDLAGAIGASARNDAVWLRCFQQDARERTVPGQLYLCAKYATESNPYGAISKTVGAVLAMAEIHSIPIWEIIEEKRAYNKERADHKRENRAAPGGKRY